MRFVLTSVGAALLVAVLTVIVWYKPGLVKINDWVISALASASTSNISVAAVQNPGASSAAAALSDIKSLAARCQIAMIKDVCGITNSSSSEGRERNTERLFIVGVGEVDASAFNRLRGAGDKMCGEVETECAANWAGAGCRIARAMYPV